MKPFKLIWTLRHGEALHNVTMNMNLHDPPLTTLGQLQALSVSAALCEIASQPEVARLLSELHSTPSQRAFPLDAVYVSPMKRTIHTAVLALGDSLSFDVSNCSADKIHGYLVPDLQEAGSWPSDVGSSLSILLGEFEALKGVSEKTREVHFPGEEWWLKTKDEAGPRALDERARRLRKWIAAREEKSVLLVSHGGFLGMLASGFWSTMGNIILRTMYKNCEIRLFKLDLENELFYPVKLNKELQIAAGRRGIQLAKEKAMEDEAKAAVGEPKGGIIDGNETNPPALPPRPNGNSVPASPPRPEPSRDA